MFSRRISMYRKTHFLKKYAKLAEAAWGKDSEDTLVAGLAEEAICKHAWENKLYSYNTNPKDVARMLLNTYERMKNNV